jgi:hypothetical protein
MRTLVPDRSANPLLDLSEKLSLIGEFDAKKGHLKKR